ncbi:MAG TPA: hypothetical protein DER58_12305, partial [Firmicutes bacterium]|nr:hypothetical protein [Bacillota bacterium]
MYITPRINKGGDITLYLKPEVSTITSTTAEGYPSISTREVETVLRVKDGETIIIGGLMRQTDLDTIYKLPILSDLPIIGNFFKFNSKSTTPKTELVFFITPKITDQGSLDISEEVTEPKLPVTPAVPETSEPAAQPSEQATGGPESTDVGTVVIEAPVEEAPIIVVVPAEEEPTEAAVTEPIIEPMPVDPVADPQPEVQPEQPIQVT